MRTIARSKTYQFSANEVFDCLDDLGVSGMHMTNSSMPMMGSKLQLFFLTEQKKGLHTKYRWTGKVLWWVMDFTVIVTSWEKGEQKTWETLGPAKLIIYSGFRMNLKINIVPDGTIATLSISYEKPRGIFNQILCFFLGDWYCKWCIEHMLEDTEIKLNQKAVLCRS